MTLSDPQPTPAFFLPPPNLVTVLLLLRLLLTGLRGELFRDGTAGHDLGPGDDRAQHADSSQPGRGVSAIAKTRRDGAADLQLNWLGTSPQLLSLEARGRRSERLPWLPPLWEARSSCFKTINSFISTLKGLLGQPGQRSSAG